MLIHKEIYDRKGKIIFSIILLILTILLLTLTKNYTINLLKTLNPEYLKKTSFFSLNKNLILKLSNDFDFYFYSQWLGKNFIQYMFLFSIMFSFSTFSKEVEQKTIYFILSKFTRKTIYHTKVLTSYVLFLFITIFGILLIYFPYILYNKPLPYNYLLFIPTFTSFFTFFYLLLTIISIVSKNTLSPLITGIVIFVIILFFETTGFIPIKIMYYIVDPAIFYNGYFPFSFVIIFTILNIVLYFAGMYLFEKMDF